MKKRIITGIIATIIIMAAIVMPSNFIVLGAPSLATDVNNDGKVDVKDIARAAIAFGAYPGHSRWNPFVDINQDGKVDMKDIAKTAKDFGKLGPISVVKFGLIVGGNEEDLGFSYMAILGAEAIANQYGTSNWQLSISRNVQFWQQRTVASQYGDQGYDLVYVVGGQFQVMMYGWDGQTPIPVLYPNTLWVQIPGAGFSNRANLVCLGQKFQIVSHYLAGVLAAYMTETNHVGTVYGAWYGYTCMEDNAFIAGVHSVDPSIVVHSRDLGGNWGDPALGYSTAQALIQTRDCDILVHVADYSGRGVISACVDLDKIVFGCVADQWSLAPDNMITSIMLDIPRFETIIAQKVRVGEFLGFQSIEIDLGYLAPYHKFDDGLPDPDDVPQSVKLLLDATLYAIKTGAITVPADPSIPPSESPP